MYRSTKNKMKRRVPVAVLAGALAAGALVAAAGAAGASTHAERSHTSLHASSTSTPADPQGPHGPRDGRHEGGRVTAVSATSLSVANLAGTATTYTLDSSTTFTKDRASASLSDVTVGELVRVRVTNTSSTTAARVDVITPHVLGRVVAVNANAITLASPDGLQTTVEVTGTTTYTKNGASATLADVTVGSFVAASGTAASDHTTFNATSVQIGVPTGPLGDGPMGAGPMGESPMGESPMGSSAMDAVHVGA